MQNKNGNRIVTIRGPATSTKKVRQRHTVDRQQATSHRLVIIKDGEFVVGKTDR